MNEIVDKSTHFRQLCRLLLFPIVVSPLGPTFFTPEVKTNLNFEEEVSITFEVGGSLRQFL